MHFFETFKNSDAGPKSRRNKKKLKKKSGKKAKLENAEVVNVDAESNQNK